MNQLFEAAQELDQFLSRQHWRYCIVGGLVISRWGEPRATQDIDICVLTELGEERRIIDALLEYFQPRIDAAAEFAEQNRVLLIRASNGVAIDVALGWTPFEESMLSRATPYIFSPGVILPTPSAEDLIVTKAFAARPQDWADVTGMVVRQRGKLDWDYIRSQLAALCELRETPEILDQLQQLRDRVDRE